MLEQGFFRFNRALTRLRQDRLFWSRMIGLVLPIMGQHFIQSSLGAVDVLMVGQLNETAVAGLGLADQLFFLLVLYLFGVSSGSAIFSAQAWGRKDLVRIHRVIGLGLLVALAGALLFAAGALGFPEVIIGLYTADQAVIEVSDGYLRIVGWSYPATAVVVVYAGVLRSTEEVRLPMITGAIALGLNSLFNYFLIFGKLGFPALGVTGAAYATAGARILEMLLLLGLVYSRRLPAAATPRQMIAFEPDFWRRFARMTSPVILTEIGWSLGQTVYNAFYARIGTESLAAINISVSIERLAFVVFIAVGSAASVMIGNRIGSGEIDRAFSYARRFMAIQLGLAVLLGLTLVGLSGWIPGFYQISPAAAGHTRSILLVMGLVMAVKATNLMTFIGILRSGGDTRFAFLIDIAPLWLIGVPLAYLGAFVFDLPVTLVYLLTMGEEGIKLALSLWRVFSRRWIHQVA